MKRASIYYLICLILSGCSGNKEIKINFNNFEGSELLADQTDELLSHLLQRNKIQKVIFRKNPDLLSVEAYRINLENNVLEVESGDYQGALYAVSDLEESMTLDRPLLRGDLKKPDFAVRAIKFNLPWSAYRESASMGIHEETCRDLKFWTEFLDMMLNNRFNTLLLYNKHPFPFMVRLEEYPEACPFSAEEMQDWRYFWNQLFSLAKERAIDVFIVNWNIVVSPSFAGAHDIPEYNDTSAVTIDYTKKSVTKLINEYPDLSGIGVTLADWMVGFTPAEKEDWIEKTFIAGMKAVSRDIKFLHRAVLSGSSDEMRKTLDRSQLANETLVEVKFNWSHGHSTPKLLITHASEAGEVNTGFWNPLPTNYKIQWMIRNEDFFILPWGNPHFIREHIRLNKHQYVNGYHIGSEGYIPALNYFDKSPGAPEYSFQRQWMFYKLWGRLLYDQHTNDEYFIEAINHRFQGNRGNELLRAYQYASEMPLMLASFFKSTWDYTLYAEGFLAPVIRTTYGVDDQTSPFISILELMQHETLDTSLLSISETQQIIKENRQPAMGKMTPNALAEKLLSNADSIINLIKELKSQTSGNIPEYELNGLEMWAYLSQYFAGKLKAAMLLENYLDNNNSDLKESAIRLLQDALQTWEKLSNLGEKNYKEVPYWDATIFGRDSSTNSFSWTKYLPQVQRDIILAKNM